MTPEERRREYDKEYKRLWRKLFPEKHRAENKKYLTPGYKAQWEAKNKEKCREYWARSRARNKAKRNADLAYYRAQKKKATPIWANRFFIDEIYRLAALRTKLSGVPHEVDHIVPLRSPLVCGLHCEANLQVIPISLNRSKHNKWWPDMPEPPQREEK